jgi:opacity protein-like surface antigen
MKKILIFCVIVAVTLFVSQSVLAQNPVNIGARLGLNFGNVSYDPDISSDVTKSMRTGFAFGGYGEIGVADNLFIVAELLYLQSGDKFEAGGYTEETKVDVFSIPISAKYKFAIENSSIKPYVFAGPNINFILSAKYKNYDGTEDDIKKNLESALFGIHFGAGAEFEVSPGTNLFLDGSYSLGLGDANKTQADEITHQKAMFRDLGIKAGVSFKVM